jgi:hypothetical protein
MAQSIIDKVEKFLDDLTELEIVTQVGAEGAAKKIATKIDLVSGDITTSMDDDFVTGPLQQMREFHATQVAKGETTVINNLEAMVRVARQIIQSRNADNR